MSMVSPCLPNMETSRSRNRGTSRQWVTCPCSELFRQLIYDRVSSSVFGDFLNTNDSKKHNDNSNNWGKIRKKNTDLQLIWRSSESGCITIIISDRHKTSWIDFRLQKSRLKYDMRKFYFTERVVDQWNSLSLLIWVVTANNTKILKRLDQYWQHQDIIFDFRAEIEGTRSRSEVSRVDIVQFIMYCCITYLTSWQRGT